MSSRPPPPISARLRTLVGSSLIVEERAAHQMHVAQLAGADDLAGALPLRVVAHHEGFGDEHVLGRRAQLLGFRGGDGDRLFAEHVLAGPRCRQGDRHVQMVGQRIVDRIDVRVGEQLLVGAVGAAVRQAELAERRLGLAESREASATTSECGDFMIPGVTLLHADIGGRDDAPADFACRPSASPVLPRHLYRSFAV